MWTENLALVKGMVIKMRNKLWQRLSSPETLSALIIVLLGVGFYVMLQNFTPVLEWLNMALSIISPFIFAFALAYLLNPMVKWFERRFSRLFKKHPKRRLALSIATTYVLALIFLAILVAMVIPQVVLSFINLFNALPGYLDNLISLALTIEQYLNLPDGTLTIFFSEDSEIITYLTDLIAGILPQIVDYSVQFGGGIIDIIMTVIVSIYMLIGKERLTLQARKLLFATMPTEKVSGVLSVLSHSHKVFSGFIIGKALDSLIIGMICFIGMSILGLPYTPLISVVIGVTNFIPFFGPFIGAIPSVFILFIVNPWDALWFGIFALALQQFDGNILGPYILGDSTGLSAMWVLVAIVVGGGLFGVVGMIIGVPVFAVLYHLTSEAINHSLNKKGLKITAGDDGDTG